MKFLWAFILRPFRRILFLKLFCIFMIAISVPVTLIVIYSNQTVENLLKTNFIAYATSMNTQVAEAIDDNIRSLDMQSQALNININQFNAFLAYTSGTIDQNYRTASREASFYLSSMLVNNQSCDGIGLVNKADALVMYVNSTGITLIDDLRIRDPWLGQTTDAKGKPIVHIMDLNRYTKNHPEQTHPVLAVTRSVIDYTSYNEPIGISLITQDITKFGDVVTRNRITDGETLVILDDGNRLVYANQPLEETLLEKMVLATAGDKPDMIETTLDGTRDHLIRNVSERSRFRTITLIPDQLIQQQLERIRHISLVLLVLLLVSVLLLSLFLTNLMVSPLRKLLHGFQKLQQGDFEVRIPVKGEDEFSIICDGFNHMVSSLKRTIKDKYEVEINLKQAELESLQSKINPHFLYNTLSSLNGIIERNDMENAHRMVQNLSDIFRYSLSKSGFIVSFSEELNHIRKYLWIQHFKYGNRFSASYDIDPEALECPILRITLQPVVENALLHGLYGKDGPGRINISAKVYEGICNIYISDDGIGIPRTKLEEINELLSQPIRLTPVSPTRKRIGIFNINARIKLYYGEAYGVSLASAEGQGTTVHIRVPAVTTEQGGHG